MRMMTTTSRMLFQRLMMKRRDFSLRKWAKSLELSLKKSIRMQMIALISMALQRKSLD